MIDAAERRCPLCEILQAHADGVLVLCITLRWGSKTERVAPGRCPKCARSTEAAP